MLELWFMKIITGTRDENTRLSGKLHAIASAFLSIFPEPRDYLGDEFYEELKIIINNGETIFVKMIRTIFALFRLSCPNIDFSERSRVSRAEMKLLHLKIRAIK